MEQAGFARAGIPGEYCPFIGYKRFTTNVASTASYTQVFSEQVVIEEEGETLNILVSISPYSNLSGTPVFRISVDGVVLGGAANTQSPAGAIGNIYRVLPVRGLRPGPHTITVDWKNGNPSELNKYPTNQHTVLAFYRNRLSSAREMDGFPARGWPMIYTCGTETVSLTGDNTSTSTTPTTPLLSMQATTHHAQGALLVRFSACGAQNGSGTERNCIFQLLVDGIARVGSSDGTGASGFSGVLFNAGFVVVVPVQAGVHDLVVNWAGGASPGTTIHASSNEYEHATLTAEEVFCQDVALLSDMEGFATQLFLSRLMHVRYSSLQRDVVAPGGATKILVCDIPMYVGGDNSALLMEFTGSSLSGGADAPEFILWLDGVIQSYVEVNQYGFMTCESITHLTPVAVGYHRVQVTFAASGGSLDAASHPEYAHANLVVREIPAGVQ